jgi:endo-1,4-beta-xylanase
MKKYDWLTKNSIQRRRMLQMLAGGAFGGATALIARQFIYNDRVQVPAERPEITLDPRLMPDRVSLQQLAAAKGITFGAAVRGPDLESNEKLAALLAKEAKIIVPEWELKWAVGDTPLRNSPTEFNFEPADRMAEFATKNNMLLRGHVLVWHESLPAWFKETVNKQNARDYLIDHINTTVGHYAGKIHSWDVVNEAIEIWHKQPNGMRKTPWLELLGEEYLEIAFKQAAQADPNALLYYNDYGLEYDNANDEAKRNAVLRLLERLKNKNVPVQVMGLQAHLIPSADNRINPKQLRQFLKNIADLGLKIAVTELDVTDEKLPKDISQRDRIVYDAYREYLDIVLAEPAVDTVVLWGLSDAHTWITDIRPRKDGEKVRPLPYDENLQPKLAWHAIAKSFDRAQKRSAKTQ